MDFKYILFDTRDHVARITLNSPKTFNGYHEPMLAEILAAIQTAREDDDTRVGDPHRHRQGVLLGRRRQRFAGKPQPVPSAENRLPDRDARRDASAGAVAHPV